MSATLLAIVLVGALGEPVTIEEHEECPGEFGVWVGEGDDAELIGSGMSHEEALEDALACVGVWKANEGRPSHPTSRFE